MVHVHIDGSDTVLVRLHVRLPPVARMNDVKREQLVSKPDHASGRLSRPLTTSLYSEDLLSTIRLSPSYHVGLRGTGSLNAHRLDGNGQVSAEASAQSLSNFSVQKPDCREFLAARSLSEELVETVPHEAPHGLLKHTPLRRVALELVAAWQSP